MVFWVGVNVLLSWGYGPRRLRAVIARVRRAWPAGDAGRRGVWDRAASIQRIYPEVGTRSTTDKLRGSAGVTLQGDKLLGETEYCIRVQFQICGVGQNENKVGKFGNRRPPRRGVVLTRSGAGLLTNVSFGLATPQFESSSVNRSEL